MLLEGIHGIISDGIQNNQINNNDLIAETVELYNTITTFITSLQKFKQLDSSIDIEALSTDLELQKTRLIHSVATHLYNQKPEHIELAENLKNEKAAQQILGLFYGMIGDHQRLEQELDKARNTISEKDVLLESNQRVINEKAALLAEKCDEIAQLISKNSQQRLEQLSSDVIIQEQFQELEKSKNVLSDTKATMDLIVNQQIAEKEKDVKHINELLSILKDKREIDCQYIINNKLTPLTSHYLLHLRSEIVKLASKPLNSKGSQFLEDIKNDSIWQENNKAKAKSLVAKFEAVYNLYNCLHDKRELRASKKIENFHNTMQAYNATITAHRDPLWLRFITNAAIAVAIVLTGILPGLAAVNTPKYWQSHGQTFFNQCDYEIEESNILDNSIKTRLDNNP